MEQTNRSSATLGVTVLALGLAACSPLPIHTSFDTLTNETSKRSSEYLTYSTFISISGIVPQHGTQLLFHQPDFADSKPNSPSLAVGISPTRSFVSERKFEMSSNAANDAKAVRDIREGLEQARLLSVGLAASRTRLNAAQTLTTAIGTNKATDDQATQVKTLLGDAVIGQDGKLVDAEVKKAIKAIQAEGKSLEAEVNKALADAKSKAAQNNVVITRWAQDKRTKLGAFFSEVFAFSGQGHEVKSGTLVFGDLRVVSLHVGDDLLDMLRSSPQTVKELIDNVGITTFSVKAKHMAYIADMDVEKAVSLRLNLTKDQLADLSATFRSLNADISASYGVTTDVANSANISNSTVKTHTRCFFPPGVFVQSIKSEIDGSSGYQDLYAVRVQVKGQILGLANQTTTAFSDIAAKCTTKDGKLDPKANGCEKDDLKAWLATCATTLATRTKSADKDGPTAADLQPAAIDAETIFKNVPYSLSK
jgi:hypothetical protein